MASEAERLLDKAARLQAEFWDALGELEGELGVDIDGTQELALVTVDDLLPEGEAE
jgi:hypothetical protein